MMQESGCSCRWGSYFAYVESAVCCDTGAIKAIRRLPASPLSLKRSYPSIVASHTEVAARVPEVRRITRRPQRLATLCVDEQHFGAGSKTFGNIECLEADAVAVVTGQQTGLFTAAVFHIQGPVRDKDVRMPAAAGHQSPCRFSGWRPEDHDLEEVSNAVVIDRALELAEVRVVSAEATKETSGQY